jgi:glycosyltransferase involved in cell wall biosynthesis
VNIIGWAADQAGCGYYRIGLPLAALNMAGHNTHASVQLPSKAQIDAADVIVGQRVCNDAPSGTWQRMAAEGRPLVYEVDDDLFGVAPTNRKAFEFFQRPNIRKNMTENVRVARGVVVSTEALAEVYGQYNPNTRVVPNSIPAAILDHDPGQRTDGMITVGWAGSGTHEMDFDEVRDQLRQFLGRNKQVEFHVMGTDYGRWMGLPQQQLRFTPWVPDVPTYHRTVDFHIGIAPLRAHTFNRSKSYIKALEYAALGIPIIASDFGPYSDFVIDGVTGFLINRTHEWGRRLRELTNDPAMRAEMGVKAREHARQFTIEENTSRWATTFSGLVS